MNFYYKNYFQGIFLIHLAKIMELVHLEDVHLGFLYFQYVFIMKIICNEFLL